MPIETLSSIEDEAAQARAGTSDQTHALEVVRLRQELARALQAQAELLAAVSHDLRGPLSVIKLATDVLLASPAQTDAAQKARRRMESIRRSTDQMTQLLGDLLDLASLENGSLVLEVQPHAAAGLVREACQAHEAHALSKSITLRVAVAPELGPIICDKERIVRVLARLVETAVKRTPDGGVVSIDAEPRAGDAGLRMRVVDSGPRVAPDAHAQLFDRHARDAGRGMTLIEGVITAHGGRIDVTSAADGGCCVELLLPA